MCFKAFTQSIYTMTKTTLFIQTSSGDYRIGVEKAGQIVSSVACDVHKEHNHIVLSDLIKHALQHMSMPITAIQQICVDIGPGGLSATRIGVAFANALAYAGQIPVFGISAFDLIAAQVFAHNDCSVIVLRKASAGHYFYSLYPCSQDIYHQNRIDYLHKNHLVVVLKQLSKQNTHKKIVIAGRFDHPIVANQSLSAFHAVPINAADIDTFAQVANTYVNSMRSLCVTKHYTWPITESNCYKRYV